VSAKSQRLVLTGITGTLGRNLIEEVKVWPGVKVLALLRAGSSPPKSFTGTEYEEVEFFDKDRVTAALQRFRPTGVIHCAASGMAFLRPTWFDMIRFNVDVTLNLCESVSRIPGCHFVFISTGLAYRDLGRALREEDPLDTQHPYGASKAAADILVRSAAAEFGVPLTVFRPFSFSGLGDSSSRLFPSLLRAAAEKRPFIMTAGDQVRDHCAAADIAHAIALSLLEGHSAGEPAQIFNLGSGSLQPLRPLVEGVAEELGLEISLRFGEKLLSPFEPKYLAGDISRARAQLQWHPRLNFAHAIWQLAQESFPALQIKEPRQWL
jgi:nucleoside-diphosphate-sugar epimerase